MTMCCWGLGGQRCFRPVTTGLGTRRRETPIFCAVHRSELAHRLYEAKTYIALCGITP